MIFTIIGRAALALAAISAMTKIDQADSNEIEEVQIGDPS